MDIVPYLSAVILVTTIATILLAVLSYAAFKLRDKRKPKVNTEKPLFFHRYLLDDGEEDDGDEHEGEGDEDDKDRRGARVEAGGGSEA